ncbi:hypothetical protein SH1V18_18200 [Vallitalea longa]|uniref:DUF3892 domain-containing protein n=1 Tax=Vallitalea longa TaxID=2936439 RepID=A0A9W6DEB6_9FIRM|nr:DUF3892 domain-containing protein [Vallitalea longa]GKX29340.1 hypothetical protein SH1V18_18200 [Vallitalea longa]
MEKAKITKVRKDGYGKITDIMLDDGNSYPIEDAIRMTQENRIEGVNVSKAKNGAEYLRSDPDGTTDNNLDNLPSF